MFHVNSSVDSIWPAPLGLVGGPPREPVPTGAPPPPAVCFLNCLRATAQLCTEVTLLTAVVSEAQEGDCGFRPLGAPRPWGPGLGGHLTGSGSQAARAYGIRVRLNSADGRTSAHQRQSVCHLFP